MEPTLQIKTLSNTAIIPTRGSDGAACFDLYADRVTGDVMTVHHSTGETSVLIDDATNAIVGTGIAMAIPKGYVGLIFARSGLACKQGLRPANCVGVIDEDYRGEIIVNLYNDAHTMDAYKTAIKDAVTKFDTYGHTNFDIHVDSNPSEIKIGERVAQIMFVKYNALDIQVVDELDETIRGTGGFGSTGKQ